MSTNVFDVLSEEINDQVMQALDDQVETSFRFEQLEDGTYQLSAYTPMTKHKTHHVTVSWTTLADALKGTDVAMRMAHEHAVQAFVEDHDPFYGRVARLMDTSRGKLSAAFKTRGKPEVSLRLQKHSFTLAAGKYGFSIRWAPAQ